MKINQLFKEKVSEELALKIVQSFGLVDLNDTSLFCKNDMIKNDTIAKITLLKDSLDEFYLPCKARCYLKSIDAKKCITLLRQILRLFGLKLHTRQKYVQSKKMTFYNIVKEDKECDNTSMRVNVDGVVHVTFD